jgi:hypothetical protein
MSWGTVTLIGSGEFSPAMARIYRRVIERIDGPVRAVFIDTPAGFELNVGQITAKAQTYFQQRLALDLATPPLRTPADAPGVTELARANFLFSGPGSPTYAVRVWRKLGVIEAFVRRVQAGAHLVFASAAALAVGRYTLPVYEIYKVGQDPHWMDGIDLLHPLGLDLAVVPHWNNSEGGTHDTAYCYMGAARLKLLEAQLPESTVMLGIDEYTACTLDFAQGFGYVAGSGGVTVRLAGREKRYTAGGVFPLAELTAGGARLALPDEIAPDLWQPHDEPDSQEQPAPAAVTPALNALIDWLVQLRGELRAAREWRRADEVRDQLLQLNVVLTDTPDGTTWQWKS